MLLGPDLALARKAASQFGVFTRAQARSCGHSKRMIQYRLESGRWEALHPTVYCAAGTPASWHRDQIAACFWCRGPAARKAAGFLYGLPGFDQPPVEVVTRDRRRAMPRCGIAVHSTTRLPWDQVRSVESIPATCIERTLLDLCGAASRRVASIAVDNALSRGLTTVGELDHCLYRTARRGRNGCARLREMVRERSSLKTYPTSPLETVVFEMLIQSSLPAPEPQFEILDEGGRFVARPDFYYPERRLAIEAHSRLWHEGVQARAADRERDARLRALGTEVLYVTWADATSYRDRTLRLIERRFHAGPDDPRAPWRAHLLLS